MTDRNVALSPSQGVVIGPTVYDLSSSTGWTTVAGGGTGTATITGGVLRLVHTVGANAYRTSDLNYLGASAYRSLGCKADFDVCARLAVIPATATVYTYIEIADASSAGERVSCNALGNGNCYFIRNNGGTELASAVGRFGGYTGQEWLRVSVRGGHVTVYTGVGVDGARPTSWLSIGGAYALIAKWSHVSLSMAAVGIAGTETVDWDDLTIVDLGGGL